MVARLRQQFAPAGNEFEWQLRLQNRIQNAEESLVEFAGSLRMLADRSYPSWTADQCRDILMSQFIHGIQSPSIQLHLMREKPDTLDDALQRAVQHESVESAQKRLHKEKKRGAESLAVNQEGGEAVNAVGGPSSKVDELAQKVRELSEEIARLHSQSQQAKATYQPGRDRSNIVCWGCRGRGHIKRYCPGRRGRRQPLN